MIQLCSHAWAEKKEPVTHCLHMLSSLGLLGIQKFLQNLLSYNLHETCQLLQYKRCLLLTTPSVDNDKGATKTLSSLPAEIVHMFINSSQTLQHLTDAIFLIFKLTNHLKRSNADCYHQSDIVFDFKLPICVSQGVYLCGAAFQQVNKN